MDSSNSIIIGKKQPCKHCGQIIRIVYVTARDISRLIEDSENLDSGRLIEHDCPVYRRGDTR